MKNVSESFLKFLLVGGIATLIQYCVLFVLVEFTPINAIYASAIGFVLGAGANYALNYRFTFRSTAPHNVALLKFSATATVGLFINTLIMAVLTKHLFVYYMLAQIIATAATLIWNFVVNSVWSFRSP